MQRNRLVPIHHARAWLSLLAFGALVLLAACGNSTPGSTAAPTSDPTPSATPTTAGSSKTVTITTDSSGNFAFSPTTLTISVGTAVIWTNMTQAPHTVTSDDGKTFDSGTANPVNSGTSFSFKFTTAGTFAYHCRFHPYMKATIIVT